MADVLGVGDLPHGQPLYAVQPEAAALDGGKAAVQPLQEQAAELLALFLVLRLDHLRFRRLDGAAPFGKAAGVLRVAGVGPLDLAAASIRPVLPAEKFFLAGKVLTGQPDMYAAGALADNGVRVPLVQSVIALLSNISFLQFDSVVCGRIGGRRGPAPAGDDVKACMQAK